MRIKRDIIVLILVAKTHDQLVKKDDEIDVNQALRKLEFVKGSYDDTRHITLDKIVGAPCGRCNHILMKYSILQDNSFIMLIIHDIKDMADSKR